MCLEGLEDLVDVRDVGRGPISIVGRHEDESRVQLLQLSVVRACVESVVYAIC